MLKGSCSIYVFINSSSQPFTVSSVWKQLKDGIGSYSGYCMIKRKFHFLNYCTFLCGFIRKLFTAGKSDEALTVRMVCCAANRPFGFLLATSLTHPNFLKSYCMTRHYFCFTFTWPYSVAIRIYRRKSSVKLVNHI